MIKAIWQNAPVDTERAWADLPTIEIIALGLAALILLWLLRRVIKSKRGGASRLDDLGRAAGLPQGAEHISRTDIRPSRAAGHHTIRNCRWRRDQRRHKHATMVRWVCSECGVDGYTSDGKPPKVCKRHQREPVLF